MARVALEPSTRNEIATVIQQQIRAAIAGESPGPRTVETEVDTEVSVRVAVDGDDLHLALHTTVVLDRPSRHTGRVLGYPATLSEFDRENVAALTTDVREAVDGAIDRSIDTEYVYSPGASRPCEEAHYRSTLDIWFEDGSIASVWIRAQPHPGE